MKGVGLLAICPLLSISSAVGTEYEKCDNTWDSEKRCHPGGGGYSDYDCVKLSKITGKQEDEETLVWQMDTSGWSKPVKCTYPRSACRCYEHFFWNDYIQGCECYNDNPRPKFPPIGVIRWNGTYSKEDYYYDDVHYIKTGEVHKNSNGHYLKIDGSAFEILIPDENGTYTQYTGKDNSKVCKVEKDVEEKTLLSIWNRFATAEKVNMQSERNTKRSKSKQVWKKHDNHGEWENFWTWEVEYDKEKDVAVPIRYPARKEVYPADRTEDTKLSYRFEPLDDGNFSFDQAEYCDNA